MDAYFNLWRTEGGYGGQRGIRRAEGDTEIYSTNLSMMSHITGSETRNRNRTISIVSRDRLFLPDCLSYIVSEATDDTGTLRQAPATTLRF